MNIIEAFADIKPGARVTCIDADGTPTNILFVRSVTKTQISVGWTMDNHDQPLATCMRFHRMGKRAGYGVVYGAVSIRPTLPADVAAIDMAKDEKALALEIEHIANRRDCLVTAAANKHNEAIAGIAVVAKAEEALPARIAAAVAYATKFQHDHVEGLRVQQAKRMTDVVALRAEVECANATLETARERLASLHMARIQLNKAP